MPYEHIYWEWEDAFNKFGFEDGDGLVMTHKVAEFIDSLGYEVRYETWGVHNKIIQEIKKDDKLIMDWEILEKKGYSLGYDSPRQYLAKDLVAALDKQFR